MKGLEKLDGIYVGCIIGGSVLGSILLSYRYRNVREVEIRILMLFYGAFLGALGVAFPPLGVYWFYLMTRKN